AHPELTWIQGGGWSVAAFENGTPTKQALDDICPDRPVFLPNRDRHSAWVNSAALRLAGIEAQTPDPADGRIERDAAGEPTGALHESAMFLVAALVPADTPEDHLAGLRIAQDYLHSLGIVGWQDAFVTYEDTTASTHAAYLQAQEQGWLTARVSAALWWGQSGSIEQIPSRLAHLETLRAEARQAGDRYAAENVKVLVDGVIESRTASLLDPYLDRCGCPGHDQGMRFFEPDVLHAVTTALDGAGFGVHFHALGDRAVRDALDAVEAAQRAHGTSDHRHQLAHLQIVEPSDRRRFRQLGAAANLQAFWAGHDDQLDQLVIPALGDERTRWLYPFGDLHLDGATLVMGSDWPVSTPDPLAGVHVAVNRRQPTSGDDAPRLNVGQALPLPVALRAYTAGSAWVNRLDQRSGTIAAGFDADLVVLSRNPFDGLPDEISSTRVDRTYVAGDLVYVRD
ncbi:MAG TPA: amidohydrolase, partial [Mycobacteriales bacterium]